MICWNIIILPEKRFCKLLKFESNSVDFHQNHFINWRTIQLESQIFLSIFFIQIELNSSQILDEFNMG
jgi:hypothetical protein